MSERDSKQDAGSAADSPEKLAELERLCNAAIAAEKAYQAADPNCRSSLDFDSQAAHRLYRKALEDPAFGRTLVAAARDRDRLAARVETQANDWCDDHTHLMNLCRKLGIPEEKVVGNPDHFPGIQELADMLAAEVERLKGIIAASEKQIGILELAADLGTVFRYCESCKVSVQKDSGALCRCKAEAAVADAALRRQVVDRTREREWRPIETAPKDGRLMLHGWTSEKCICVGTWYTDKWGSDDSYETSYRIEPTHWMPLPPQPH